MNINIRINIICIVGIYTCIILYNLHTKQQKNSQKYKKILQKIYFYIKKRPHVCVLCRQVRISIAI